jgi:hypothetical protein
MKGRFISGVIGGTVALLAATSAFADEHGHHGRRPDVEVRPAAPPDTVRDVTVRAVQVRDVVVNPPPAVRTIRTDPATARPFLPDTISRPPQSRSFRPAPPSNRGSTRIGRRYYSFSPRGSLGYGLLVGYPVAFPYPWAYPFVYEPPSAPIAGSAAPPRNTYSNVDSVSANAPQAMPFGCGVEPSVPTPCGGLSFDVAPSEAQVSVEGMFVGTVDRFSPSAPPLMLSPGLHYVEVRLPGYRTVAFEVTVGAGEVTPYQGSLEPLRTQ